MASTAPLTRGGPPLTIRLLGPFEARLGDEPLPRLRSRKGSWLLALLALRHGREVERSWLAGTLWPDSSEADAYASLRKSLADLRAALGEDARRLRSPTSHSLLLELSGAAVDVLEFDATIRCGDPVALERAVSLYRGPLLEGCDQEWVLAERRVRETAYLEALERLAAIATAGGNPAAAVRSMRQVVAVDPLRESAQRALMQGLAESGSPAAATLVYRELRLLLHRELNAKPAAETVALYEQIRTAAREQAAAGWLPRPHPAPAPPPVRLPSPLTGFIGRQQEVREVAAWLGGARLVTLTGTGGVGKTRLAIQAARGVAGEFLDGVAFVALASLRDPSLVPQAVAAALAVHEEPGRTLAASLGNFLAPRHFLLVLDNCEHLLEACARLVDGLLNGCPQLHILTTSRQPLGITGEASWRVPSLSLPAAHERGSLHESHPPFSLDQFDAVRLFVERAVATRPEFRLNDRNANLVLNICQRLDGIPLAIELAATRLRVLSLEQIAARLDDRFRLLTCGSRTALARQQTLRATMDWSYDLLTGPERVLFRRLSVFAGGFSLEEAESVCGAADEASPLPHLSSSIPPDDVLDLLTGLVEKSLVWAEEGEGALPGQPRYRLPESTREYAREQLEASGEVEALRRAHAHCFLAVAEAGAGFLRGSQQVEGLHQLAGAYGNLRAALAWCARPEATAAEAEGGLRLAAALEEFWYRRGLWAEGRHWVERALAGRARGSATWASVLLGASKLARAQGDTAAGRSLAEASLAICEELGDRAGIARAISHLAWTVSWQGDLAAARRLHERSLRIRCELGDRMGMAGSLNNLGTVAYDQGDYAQARVFHQQASEIFRELGSEAELGEALGSLGEAAYAEGNQVEAQACFAEALLLFHEVGHMSRIEWMLGTLAAVAAAPGGPAADSRRAAQLAGAAEALSQRLGSGTWARVSARYAGALAVARCALGETAFGVARVEGQAMTLEAAIAYALEATAQA